MGGEAEWSARKHSGPKRRVWRKVHPEVEEKTLEKGAVGVTIGDPIDAPRLPDLFSQICPQEIEGITPTGPATHEVATTSALIVAPKP